MSTASEISYFITGKDCNVRAGNRDFEVPGEVDSKCSIVMTAEEAVIGECAGGSPEFYYNNEAFSKNVQRVVDETSGDSSKLTFCTVRFCKLR